jgi:hypothetical protein
MPQELAEEGPHPLGGADVEPTAVSDSPLVGLAANPLGPAGSPGVGNPL